MPTNPSKDAPLKVLVCDGDVSSAQMLLRELESSPTVVRAIVTTTVGEAAGHMESQNWNAVFIDPLSVGLNEATEFIFNIRNAFPFVVFVLFIDRSAAERRSVKFYSDQRSRFRHYFSIDKRGPVADFRIDVSTVLEKCIDYLQPWVTLQQINDIRDEATSLVPSSSGPTEAAISALTSKIDALLVRFPSGRPEASVRTNSVFLSCRFAEVHYIEGLKALLADAGFEVVTGDNASGYISQSILERIREAEFFICLMTRDEQKADGTYTTSPWLLEEKGAALAFGKYIVLLIEEGVTGIGGLQGDWQRHHFSAKGFITAALNAVKQIQSAAGRPSS